MDDETEGTGEDVSATMQMELDEFSVFLYISQDRETNNGFLDAASHLFRQEGLSVGR